MPLSITSRPIQMRPSGLYYLEKAKEHGKQVRAVDGKFREDQNPSNGRPATTAGGQALQQRGIPENDDRAGSNGPSVRNSQAPVAGGQPQIGGILSARANPSNNPVRSRAPEVPETRRLNISMPSIAIA